MSAGWGIGALQTSSAHRAPRGHRAQGPPSPQPPDRQRRDHRPLVAGQVDESVRSIIGLRGTGLREVICEAFTERIEIGSAVGVPSSKPSQGLESLSPTLRRVAQKVSSRHATRRNNRRSVNGASAAGNWHGSSAMVNPNGRCLSASKSQRERVTTR